MRKKCERPLVPDSHLPLILLGGVMASYGLLTALAGSWISNQAMRGFITTAVYRSRLESLGRITGLAAGIVFGVLFILCAVHASGISRVAFAIGTLASGGPLLTGYAERLLFNVIGLPTMNAGSVLADAAVVLCWALPMTILFALLACGRCVPRGCRWLSLVSVPVVLATALFPIYVTVLAFLLKPGDPTVGRMMEVGSQVSKLRFILPGVSLLIQAFISQGCAKQQAEGSGEAHAVEKGDEK